VAYQNVLVRNVIEELYGFEFISSFLRDKLKLRCPIATFGLALKWSLH